MKKYLIYDGERFVRDMSFDEAIKFSGLSKPTFLSKMKQNTGVIRKDYQYIVKRGAKYEMFYMLELTKFFIENTYEPEKFLPEVKEFYKKISLTL